MLGLFIVLGQTLEVCRGHIVEQQVIFKLEKLAQSALEMTLQLRLVGQKRVQRPIQPIVIHLRDRHTQ